MVMPNLVTVKDILQDVGVNVFTHPSHNSQDKLDSSELQLPDTFPENMVVAIQPNEEYDEKYWLAKIIEQITPTTYRVHYFKYHGKQQNYKLDRGKNAKGICPIGAIMVAGVNFNENGSVTAASLRHINYAVINL